MGFGVVETKIFGVAPDDFCLPNFGETFCSSLQVAETLEKRHDNVWAAIENAIETRNNLAMVMVKMVNLVKLLRNEDRKCTKFTKFTSAIYSLRFFGLVETFFLEQGF
jgi:hypothetical protein